MSFVDQDDVIALGEDVARRAVAAHRPRGPAPIPRMTYADAMARYGSDKPDLRFGLELVELHRVLRGHPVPGVPGAVRRRRGHAGRRRPAAQAARRLAGVGQAARRQGLAYVLVGEDGELGGPVAKNLSDAERAGLATHVGAAPGDCVFFAAGAAQVVAGAARRRPARDRPARRARSTRPPGRSSGSSTRRCSSRDEATDGDVAVGSAPGRRCTTPSPRPSRSAIDTLRAATRARRWRTPTTSSATATRSAAARSVSTAATCRSACSR